MRQFIKQLLAVILGNAIFFGLSFLMFLFIIIGSIVSSDQTPSISSNSILKVSLSDNLSELPMNTEDLFSDLNEDQTLGVYQIIDVISDAANNSKIKGLIVEMNYASEVSYSHIDLIRNAIIEFKKSKKPTYAYGEIASQKSYYLATACDYIGFNPNGMIDLRGFGAQITFFKSLLNKLSVEPQIYYAGKFKSATEPYRLDKMSDENKEQTKELLSAIKNNVWHQIAKARKTTPIQLDSIANQMLSTDPKAMAGLKMIDKVAFWDQIELKIKEDISEKKEKNLKVISTYDYYQSEIKTSSKGPIAVYVAEGAIVDGKGQKDEIGSETAVKNIRKLAEDKSVKGVVLRVNSPGGSALASGTIHRELILLSKKKPVVVSMGPVAASGGYYISMLGQPVYAEPNTITGSIGVFSIIPNLKKTMEDKLGLTFDEVELNDHAVMGVNKPFEPAEATRAQAETERIYTTFKSIVSNSRKLTLDQVEAVAQGRVWDGNKAQSIRLIDSIGTLQDAVNHLAKRLNVDNQFYIYNSKPSILDELKNSTMDLRGSISSMFKSILIDWLNIETTHYFSQNTEYLSPQMKIFFDIKI